MRVVAGIAGGRVLEAPPGRAVRPTTDRVREAVFSGLEARGLVVGCRVLDLFAGTGAMGIEALSRGAASATFVEADARAVACIRANLARTGLVASATVVQADALAFCRGSRGPSRASEGGAGVRDGGASDPAAAPGDLRWDLALADPPYRFGAWDELITGLPAPVGVLESDRLLEPPPGWLNLSVRRHGGTVVTLVVRAPVAPGSPA